MNRRVLVIGLAALAAALAAQGASGAPPHRGPVVFVQTNETNGNRVVTYDVGSSGTLTQAGDFATGGNGGVAAPGTETDRLASQGSLAYDAGHGLLFAVNAGSNTVSTFSVSGDALHLEAVVPSGAEFPASVAVSGKLVYVLNSGGSGTVQGFRIAGDKLQPIQGSARDLGLANKTPPNFLTAPGQVGFTPDGRHLLVTTKASGSAIDAFSVAPDGRLSAHPVQNASATPVPFAFTFTPDGRLADGEAATSSLTTYAVQADGTLTDAKTASDGQTALCWVQRVGAYYYVSNTGSNTVSAFTVAANGQPSLLGTVATTAPGPIDLTSPSGTSYLYVETGGGTVGEFLSNSDGSLTSLGTVTGLPAGIEGIAST
jgi:6-phosphogluconolactonase (cycloisomerase 2 family)